MFRKKRFTAPVPSSPPWVFTYADMMSLLLAVFVLLAAMSNVNEKKLRQALVSLQGAFGAARGYAGDLASGQPFAPNAMVERFARDLQREMQILAMDQDVRIEYDRKGGVRIALGDDFLFNSGDATIRVEALPALKRIGELISGIYDCVVSVRGHSDDRATPKGGKYADNYALSFARADNVARRVQNYGRSPMSRFEITACGPSRPIATNDTEAGRQANRRVEILVMAAAPNSETRRLEIRASKSGDADVQ